LAKSATAKRVSREVYKVGEQLAEWEAIKKLIDSDDLDEQTLLDTLEGATELHEAIAAIGENMLELKAMEAGLASTIANMTARKQRFTSQYEKLRAVVASAMDTAEIDSIPTPAFTFSIARYGPKPLVTDENAIPAKFWKAGKPTLDRKALAEALDDKEKIPGATLDNGSFGITMRSK
jgi:hypothetical protein